MVTLQATVNNNFTLEHLFSSGSTTGFVVLVLVAGMRAG